jgi:hypothetical protein
MNLLVRSKVVGESLFFNTLRAGAGEFGRHLSVDHLRQFDECRRFEGDEFRIGHQFE